MTSLTVINTHPSDKRMGSATCYLVATTSSNGMSSLSGNSTRLAPKQQQQRLSLDSHMSHQNSEILRTKRRIHFSHINSCHSNGGIQQTAAVARRNERERNRVRLVNMGFATLRQHVPHATKNKKMSKVDTLRSAVEYIKQLQELLQEQDSSSGCSTSLRTRDENSYPSYDSAGSVQSTNSNSVISPTGSGASSPTPSLCSDPSSPLDLLNAEEDELIDFTSWF